MKKSFLVTGAALENGGHAIAERFAREGYDVFVTSRRIADADAVAKDLSSRYGVFAKGYILDLRSDDVYSVFKDIDSLGYTVTSLCLNAADLALGPDPSRGVPFFENTPEYFRDIIEANLVGNFKIAREAALRMKDNGGGAIVFIGSNTSYRPNCNRVAYVASKGGICSMSRSIAVDLGVYGIRSNVVLPGTIKTKRWVGMGDKQISNATMVPLDISDFDDVANAVWYLGTEQSKNVTGTELVVDGGMTAQLYPDVLNKYRREELERNREKE